LNEKLKVVNQELVQAMAGNPTQQKLINATSNAVLASTMSNQVELKFSMCMSYILLF
jgi:hypothetical protein